LDLFCFAIKFLDFVLFESEHLDGGIFRPERFQVKREKTSGRGNPVATKCPMGTGIRQPSPAESTVAESDARFAEIVGRHFHVHPVAHADANEILAHLAGDMGQNFMTVGQSHAEHRAGQYLRHGPCQFDWFFFSHCKKPPHSRPAPGRINLRSICGSKPKISSGKPKNGVFGRFLQAPFGKKQLGVARQNH
jgi:hypothetical protein